MPSREVPCCLKTGCYWKNCMVEIIFTSGSPVGGSFPYGEEIINLTSQLHSMSVPSSFIFNASRNQVMEITRERISLGYHGTFISGTSDEKFACHLLTRKSTNGSIIDAQNVLQSNLKSVKQIRKFRLVYDLNFADYAKNNKLSRSTRFP